MLSRLKDFGPHGAIAFAAIVIGNWAGRKLDSPVTGVLITVGLFLIGIWVVEWMRRPKPRLRRRRTKFKAGPVEWERQTMEDNQKIEGADDS